MNDKINTLTDKSLYKRWLAMRAKCKRLKVYYCLEWKSYYNFYHWARNNGYSKELHLKRIDETKNFSPENCEWGRLLKEVSVRNNTALYGLWVNMKVKCDVPSSFSYKYCGALGITYCEEWKDFQNFHNWALANEYQTRMCLLRIDKTKNFEPENCKFGTREDAANNSNSKYNVKIFYDNKWQTVSQWSRELNIKYTTLRNRLKIMSVEKAFSKRVNHNPNSRRNRLKCIWYSSKLSCYNIHATKYKDYGGKGIKFYDEWLEYSKFEQWALNNGYKENLCLGRRDRTKDFGPSNCYWDTRKGINRCKSSSILLYFNGKVCCAAEVARKLKIKDYTFIKRLNSNKPKEQLFHVGSLKTKKDLEKTE